MIKTLKNELNKDKKPVAKQEKPRQPFIIKKPLIYYKVEEQRVREKIENEFFVKKLFLLKKKYFYIMKFYFKKSIFVKKQRKSIFSRFFFGLKKATTMIKNKNHNILKYYKKLFKLKIFYAWAKQTRIIINSKLIRESFRNVSVYSFLNKVKSKKNLKKLLINMKKFCFAKLILYKFHNILPRKIEKLRLVKKIDEKFRMFLFRKLFGKVYKKSFYFQTLFQKFKSFFKKMFFQRIKLQIYKKKIQKLVIKTNKKRIYYYSFKKSFEIFITAKLKYRLTTSFHKEYIKLAFFNTIKHSKMINSKFIKLIKSFYNIKRNSDKSVIIELYNETKE